MIPGFRILRGLSNLFRRDIWDEVWGGDHYRRFIPYIFFRVFLYTIVTPFLITRRNYIHGRYRRYDNGVCRGR